MGQGQVDVQQSGGQTVSTLVGESTHAGGRVAGHAECRPNSAGPVKSQVRDLADEYEHNGWTGRIRFTLTSR